MTSNRLNHSARARELLGTSLIWDNHGCLPLRVDETVLRQLERYRDSGVNVVSINVGYGEMSWDEHVRILTFMRDWLAARPEKFGLIANTNDIARCRAQGKLGVVFDVEGMVPVQDDPSRVRMLYDLGVRWMLIAYNRNNLAGGGCLDVDQGLTDVGRQVIDEMQSAGMVLCLSHCGARTAREAIEYSRNPVIFSHANPYGAQPHVRNVTDDLIRDCARAGGVIGLSGFGPYLGASDDLVSHLVRQLHYVLDLAGADHVGLGLDHVFDQAEVEEFARTNPHLFPLGLSEAAMIRPEDLLEIVDALARSNLTDEQIAAILGGNWLRVAGSVWR